MFHGVIEANSSARAAESRLVNDSDDADGFLTGAARHGCQHWCAQVAGGIRAGLCRRPLQPINAQHRNLHYADCEATASGARGCRAIRRSMARASLRDLTRLSQLKTNLAFCNLANHKSQNRSCGMQHPGFARLSQSPSTFQISLPKTRIITSSHSYARLPYFTPQ